MSAVDYMIQAVTEGGSNVNAVPDEEVLGDLETLDSSELNIFVPLRESDYLKDVLQPVEATFKQPMLQRSSTREGLEYIQRLCGRSGAQSRSVAAELVNDLQRCTYYPGDYGQLPDPSDLAAKCRVILDDLDMKVRAEGEKDA